MGRLFNLTLALSLPIAASAHASAPAVSLRGSPAAMVQQNRVAKDHGLTFHRTPVDIQRAVDRGELAKLEGNGDYAVADFVSYPYLHPDVKLFVERLAAQYREACGQRLVVTSGVRPANGQPSNSHALSVHPAGMAVDLRVSDRAECRSWLEATLLNLEGRGVLNGIREFRPPHYHVAVFPEPYRAYAAEAIALEEEARREQERSRVAMMTKLAASVLHEADPASSLMAAGEKPGERRPLTTAIALILALPFGLGLCWTELRRRRKPETNG